MNGRFLQMALCVILALVFFMPGAPTLGSDSASVTGGGEAPAATTGSEVREETEEESTRTFTDSDFLYNGEITQKPDNLFTEDGFFQGVFMGTYYEFPQYSSGTGSRAGQDVHPLTVSWSNDLQENIQVDIELEVNNTGTGDAGAVTCDLEIQNYFERIIHTDQKTISGGIPAGETRNTTYTYTPDEATAATFKFTTTCTGDVDTSNDDGYIQTFIYVWMDFANYGENNGDWATKETPWHIDDTVWADDTPIGGGNTKADLHTAPEVWHCGNDAGELAGQPLEDDYDNNIDNKSIFSNSIDWSKYWFNTDEATFNSQTGGYDWPSGTCTFPEHAWLIFGFTGQTSSTGTGDAEVFHDYAMMHIEDPATGDAFQRTGEIGGDLADGWWGYFTDVNGNGDYDQGTDVFAMNMNVFIEDGGTWQHTWSFLSDNIPDVNKEGIYFDDFRIIAMTPNPIEKDCYTSKIGDVGLTEPGVAKSIDVWVYNRAVQTANDVPVKLEVDGSVVDTKTISSVSPDSDQKVTMVWTPDTPGFHELTVYSDLPDDEYPDNDETSFQIHAYPIPESIDDDTDVLIVDNDHGVNNSGFFDDSDYFFIDGFDEYADLTDATHMKSRLQSRLASRTC